MAVFVLVAMALSMLLARLEPAHSLSFELHKHDTKCLSEEIHSGVLVLAEYHAYDAREIEKPPSHKIHARVTDPEGTVMHVAEGVERGQFGFKAAQSGSYLACFWMEGVVEKEASVAIELDWKSGVAAKDWGNIAKREQIDGLELELRKLEDLVDSIHDEMLFLREKEQEMREFNEVTSRRVLIYSGMSLFLCLLVAAFQSLHLKTFFERKKLL